MSRHSGPAERSDRLLAQLQSGPPILPDGGGRSYTTADMPQWLFQVAAALVEGQEAATVRDRVARISDQLDRLSGRVPFSVVHDWHAHCVAPTLAELIEPLDRASGLQETVRLLHVRALAGERVSANEWTTALEPALRQVYRHAYAYADSYALTWA